MNTEYLSREKAKLFIKILGIIQLAIETFFLGIANTTY